MKKFLMTAALLITSVSAAWSQFCVGCIQNSAAIQNAQMNIASATIRGTLTVGGINISTISVSTATAGVYVGSGTFLTNLNASQLKLGTVPQAAVAGSYPSITGIGTVASGAWNGAIIASPFGGTGANLGTANPGSIPYFSSVGTMSVIAPGLSTQLLQSNGSAAPSYTSAPQVLGTNVTAIPLANLIPGQLPPNIAINDASISTVSAAKVIGNIPGNAANIVGTLPLSQLGAGTLVNSIVASSITATGVTPGIWGGPTQLIQETIGSDGRIIAISQSSFTITVGSITSGPLPPGVTIAPNQITSGALSASVIASSLNATGIAPGSYGFASQTASFTVTADGRLKFANNVQIAINTNQINNGALPAGVVVPAANVQSGVLPLSVIASSVNATGVAPGIYGSASTVPQIVVGVDGRLSSASSIVIPAISTSVVYSNQANAWTAPQTYFSSITIHDNLSAVNVAVSSIAGDGSGLFNLQASQLVGQLPNGVVASSVSIPFLTLGGAVTAGNFIGDGSGLTSVTASSVAAHVIAPVVGDGTIGAPIGLNSSSVTLQGNTFNGTSQLVQTTTFGKYPPLDGSFITNLSTQGAFASFAGSQANAIPFITTSGSTLTFNVNGLSFDPVNKRLGIRTANPIHGIDCSSCTYFSDGNSPTPILIGNNGSTMTLTSAGNLTIPGIYTGSGAGLTNLSVNLSTVTQQFNAVAVATTATGISLAATSASTQTLANAVAVSTTANFAAINSTASALTNEISRATTAEGVLSVSTATLANVKASTGTNADITNLNGTGSGITFGANVAVPNPNILTVSKIASESSQNLSLLSSSHGVLISALGGTFSAITAAGQGVYLINNNFGVFTPVPKYQLDVTGDAAIRGQEIVTGTTTVFGNAFSVGGGSFVVVGGNVGIGTTTPSAPLEIIGGNNVFDYFGSSLALASDGVGVGPGSGMQMRRFAGTVSSPTAISDNKVVGAFGASGYDGTGWPTSDASMSIVSSGPFNSSSHGGFINFNVTAIGTTTLVSAMRLTDNGSLGIGTTTPGATLDVNGGAQFGAGATKSTFTSVGSLFLASGSTLAATGFTVFGSSVAIGTGGVDSNFMLDVDGKANFDMNVTAGANLNVTSTATAAFFVGNGYSLTNITLSSCTSVPNTTFTNTTFGVAMATVTLTTRGLPTTFVQFVGTGQNTTNSIRTSCTILVDSSTSFFAAKALSSGATGSTNDMNMGIPPTPITGLSAASHTFALACDVAANTGTILNDASHYTQLCATERP